MRETDRPGGSWTFSAGWGVAFLTVILAFNYLDRTMLGLLLPLIKADLLLSDTTLGLISGLAFTLFYSLLGIPIASLADRSNRRNIIAAGFALWSLMTVVTGWVGNAWQLAACRFLLGAGEAAGLAPSQAMIADKVTEERRPLALSILATASPINGLLFIPIAGWTADHYGWRTAFHLAGVVGLVLALLFFLTVREPPRRRAVEDKAVVPLLEAIRTLAGNRAFLWILVGASFTGGSLYATAAWTTTMLVRVHDFSVTRVATLVTPLEATVAACGVLATGWLTNRLGRRDRRWRLWVPAITCFACVPGYLAFLLGDAWQVWATGFAVVAFFHLSYMGPIYAAVVSIAPPAMRAVAVSILVMFTGLVGQLTGPLIVGVLNDVLHPSLGIETIRYSLLVVAASTLIGGLCFMAAPIGRDAPTT